MAGHVTSLCLPRISVDHGSSKHGMIKASDFVLELEHLLTRSRVDDIPETVLMGVAFLHDEAAFEKPPV